MNTSNIKSAKWIVATVLLALGGSGLSSCSKDSSTEQVITADAAKLSVNVSGIVDEQSISTKSNTTTAKAKLPKIETYPEFDAAISIDNNLPASPLAIASERRNGGANIANAAQAAAMEAGVKYRLFLFNPDGTLYSSTPLTSGTAGSLSVVPGTTYKWVALSYNNAEEVADLAAGSTEIALPGGKDVLYASGNITTGDPAGAAINISFKRKFSRLGVELNTMGMFADMEAATVKVSGLSVETATIDLATGSLKDFIEYPQTIDFASFENIDAAYQDAKIAYIYTANNNESDINVAVSNLKIKLDDNTSRQFSSTTNFNFGNVTPVMGNSHRLLVNLIESPLTTTAAGLSGGVDTKWARQNLYYTGGHNPYRFHHTYAPSDARNTYFSFKGIVPEKFGKDGDPCALVYPEGTWKTADENNFRGLVGSLVAGLGSKAATYGTTNYNGTNVGFAEYTATGTAAPYPSNKLRFNYNGQQIVVSLVEDLINVNLGTFATEANYWTRGSLLDLGAILNVGPYNYQGRKSTFGNNVDQSLVLNLGVKLLALDVLQSNFKNIRCVR